MMGRKQITAEEAAGAICRAIVDDARDGHALLRRHVEQGSPIRDHFPAFSEVTEREFTVMMFVLETETLGQHFDVALASRLRELSMGEMARTLAIESPVWRAWCREYSDPLRSDLKNGLDPFTPFGFLSTYGVRAGFVPRDVPGVGETKIGSLAATQIAVVLTPLIGRWKKIRETHEITI